MATTIYHKYPDETRKVVFDYSSAVDQYGTTITTPITVATISPPDGALTISGVAHASDTVTCLIAGGTAGATYEFGCIATTVDGQLLRINGKLIIRLPGDI